MSAAKVKIWNTVVGYLYWDDHRQIALFESDDAYLNADFNLSPILHKNKKIQLFGDNYHEKFKGLVPLFNDSLPDAFGNQVFKEWVEQQGINQTDLNPIERLLYVGKRGIGALEYEVEKSLPAITQNVDLNDLSAISDLILKRKYNQKDFLRDPNALFNMFKIGSSVGGAQAKVLIAKDKKNQLFAGDIMHDFEVDYFVVKLEHDQEHKWNSEKNKVEFVYNKMAQEAGIDVAPFELLSIDGRNHFASKRFDRVNNQKIHTQTVSALAGFHGRNNEFGYEDIFKMIEMLGLEYQTKVSLFKQMAFNVAASNRDDHTKNFTFLMNNKGDWSLSPAYDLTFPYDPYQSFSVPHQISLNGKTKEITRNDILSIAKKAAVKNPERHLEQVLTAVDGFSDKIIELDISFRTKQLIEGEIEQNINRLRK